LKWDAKKGHPGYIDGKYLWLARSKSGVNPWIPLNDPERPVRALLDAMRAWNGGRSPWYFPGRYKGVLGLQSLSHGLCRVCPVLGLGSRTAHGMRAFYVTVRRSQGIPDVQIAAEIGDKTPSIIAQVYGAVPPDWHGGPQINFLPTSFPSGWSGFLESKSGQIASK